MIDTQDKLEAFVKEHRLAMLTVAVRDFSADAESSGDDVWTIYFNRETNDRCDINIFRPEGSNEIYIKAYALKQSPKGARYGWINNTETEYPVATITLG
jgi:hypothetical protein